MARVTVEDCIVKVPNRFELVILSGQRARQLSAGAPLTIERDHDKNPVIALREIAEETVPVDSLREAILKNYRRHVEIEPQEEEFAELFAKETAHLKESLSEDPFAEVEDEEEELDEEEGESFEPDENLSPEDE